MKRTMYLVLAMSIVVVGAALAFGSQLAQTTEVSVNSSAAELQKPEWKVGDWWVVEVGQRGDMIAIYPPPWFEPIKWKFDVTAVQQIRGEKCFVVEVSNLEGLQIEKAVLYHRTEDLSLIEHSGSYAGYPLMPFAAPAFPAEMVTIPFDIPGIPNANATVDYTKVTYGKADAKCYKVDVDRGYQLWHPNAPWWLYYEGENVRARLVDCSWWQE